MQRKYMKKIPTVVAVYMLPIFNREHVKFFAYTSYIKVSDTLATRFKIANKLVTCEYQRTSKIFSPHLCAHDSLHVNLFAI